MTDVTIRIGLDQISEIEECKLAVEFSMDKITEVGQGIDKATEMTLGEEILEVMQECIKIRILEDRMNRGGYRGNYRNENYERGRCRSRERSYSSNIMKEWQK